MLRYAPESPINRITFFLPLIRWIDSLRQLAARNVALLPRLGERRIGISPHGKHEFAALPPVPEPPPFGAIRLDQNAQPATIVESVHSLPRTGKPDGGVGQRHGVSDEPLEAG